MGNYVTISTKVRKELIDEARKLGINISSTLRSALEEEVRKRKLEILKARLNELSEALDKIDINEVVKIIREGKGLR